MSGVEAISGFDVVNQRFESGSQPLERTDDYRVIAVPDPGAMRSFNTAVKVSVFDAMGYSPTVDGVHGASSPSIIGMCLANGQARELFNTFYNRVASRAFVNLLRPFVLKPIVDIDYLINDILKQDPKLDWEAVRDSKIAVHAVAKFADKDASGKNTHQIFSTEAGDFDTEEGVFSAIGASCKMPYISGLSPYVHQGEMHQGERYWDAMDACLDLAAYMDPTHIIVFKSSRKPHRGKLFPVPVSISKHAPDWDIQVDEISHARDVINPLTTKRTKLATAAKYAALGVIQALNPEPTQIAKVEELFDSVGIPFKIL